MKTKETLTTEAAVNKILNTTFVGVGWDRLNTFVNVHDLLTIQPQDEEELKQYLMEAIEDNGGYYSQYIGTAKAMQYLSQYNEQSGMYFLQEALQYHMEFFHDDPTDNIENLSSLHISEAALLRDYNTLIVTAEKIFFLLKAQEEREQPQEEKVNEAKKFTVKKLGDDYYPYGLYYDKLGLVSGLRSNSKKEVENAIQSISKALGIGESVNEE